MEDAIYPVGYFVYILRDYLCIFVCLCVGVCMCGGQERTLGVILPLSASSFEAEFSWPGQSHQALVFLLSPPLTACWDV